MSRVTRSLWFGGTTFAGAFLLFFSEPLMGRFILPWFGGTSGVWTTCLLFFQVCLLAGYAYAHGLVRWLPERRQVQVHVLLLLASLWFLPIAPGPEWKPSPTAEPITHILRLLTACLGLPFLVLSTTGPLMQAWYSRVASGESPYRLYALSNFGSLLALLAYPFVFEPWLSRQSQAELWSWGYAAYGAGCAACAIALWRTAAGGKVTGGQGVATAGAANLRIPLWTRTMWWLLPACAATLLLAVTNTVSQDMATMPFLWVVPLSLYLLSFVCCFASQPWYHRGFWMATLALTLPWVCYAMFTVNSTPWLIQAGIYFAALFAACMVCHGELYRLRPAPARLTSFYLSIAAGGALGGLFVAVFAPLMLNNYYELHLTLVLVAAIITAILYKDSVGFAAPGGRRLALWPYALSGAVLLALTLTLQVRSALRDTVASFRNFYGILHVEEIARDNPVFHAKVLRSGGTTHGMQYVQPSMALRPTTYYGEQSGIARLRAKLPRNGPRRIGVVGLGTGTLATYGEPGDTIRFYEINPKVVEVARTYFSYLAQSRAQIEIVPGDARLALEREPPQQFTVLVLDAFNSDAIPVHLLTREAFAIYLRHLAPDGTLAVHISNRHLQLLPVVEELARHFDWPSAFLKYDPPKPSLYDTATEWVLLSRHPALLAERSFAFNHSQPTAAGSSWRLWTDEFTSLFRVLRGFQVTPARPPGR